jgi:hypothetical protein
MKRLKVLAASVALALGASSASAAMTLPNTSTGSTLFLTAWVDNVVTYARNLGITLSTVLNNSNPDLASAPNAAWVSESGALFDKNVFGSFAGDANWTASNLATLYGSSTVRWNITAAETGVGGTPQSYVSTFDLATDLTSPGQENGSTIFSRANVAGQYIGAVTTPSNFLSGPTPDCAANNSCYLAWNGSNNATADGSPFGSNWTGEDTASEGSESGTFWYYQASASDFTNRTPLQFKNSMSVGQWFLESDGDVRYELAAAIPVPAAVWLFGSGLLGFAAVARRRKSAAGAQFA